MPTVFRVTPSQLAWLGQAFPEKNIISPLAAFTQQTALSEEDESDLIRQGIVAQDGTIQPTALAVFHLLAGADGFSRIRILGVTAPADKVVFYKGEMACSVDSSQGRFTITYPPDIKESTLTFEEFTGSSRLINIPFQAQLAPNSAMVFLALLDLQRRANLLALAGENPKMAFGTAEITEMIHRAKKWSWLAYALHQLAGERPWREEEVRSALRELLKKGLIAASGENFRLVSAAWEVAQELLLPEYVFNIAYGRLLSPKTIEHSQAYVVYCGSHNILYLEAVGDLIAIETIAGSDLLMMLRRALFGNPDIEFLVASRK